MEDSFVYKIKHRKGKIVTHEENIKRRYLKYVILLSQQKYIFFLNMINIASFSHNSIRMWVLSLHFYKQTNIMLAGCQ